MKVSLVEHRGQWRIDLDEFEDSEKIELIQRLAENTAQWGKWRFTNHAIWINQNAEDLVAIVKMLSS